MRQISDTVVRKFEEVVSVSDWQVETEDGWVDITSSNLTIEYPEVCVSLKNGTTLFCADTHILIDMNQNEVFAIDSIGKNIYTKHGSQKVESVEFTGSRKNMYDLSVGGNHIYYTNDILSHNTEVSAAYVLLETIFNPNFTSLVVSYQQSGAIEILDRIKFMYESMPPWLVPGVKTWNRQSVEFENGSKIVARATTKNAGRGLSISLLYADELAIVPKNIVEEFWEAVYPVLSTGGQCLVTSTPKGDNNRFYFIWRDAYILKKEDNTFFPVFLHWSRHPDRDEAWAQKMRRSLGDESKWQQEFECSFLSNAATVIDLKQIDNMSKLVRTQIDPPSKFMASEWTFWYKRRPDWEYFIFVDVSEGVGGDYHAINVFDERMRQCALFHSNTAALSELARHVHMISDYFNEANIYLEINGPGMAVIPYLTKFYEIPERVVKEKLNSRDYGLRMTSSRRNEGIVNMANFLSQSRVEINSIDAINELRTFKRGVNRRKFEAEFGCHDDIVMTMVMMFSMIKKMSNQNDSVWEALYGEGNIEGQESEELDDMEYEPVPPMLGNPSSNVNSNDSSWLLG